MSEFPKLGINTQELIAWTDLMLNEARMNKFDFGAVNWGDLGVADIEYRLSVLHPESGPSCMVTIEEASPDCGLGAWLNACVDRAKFPNTYFECEW